MKTPLLIIQIARSLVTLKRDTSDGFTPTKYSTTRQKSMNADHRLTHIRLGLHRPHSATLLLILIGLFIGLALGGCSSQATKALPPASYATQAREYVIGSGDLLNVFVWGEPQLSTDVVVRPDGRITTPLVQDVQASGKTPKKLANDIAARLKAFVKNPFVTVRVKSFVGRYSEQIRVIGEAVKPQSLPYRENMTLLDVLIAVGGLTEFAAGNKAVIIREAGGTAQRFPVRLDDLLKDGDISANVDMQPGDILMIPETWF
jgi:polysaccharide export outer membrane protein